MIFRQKYSTEYDPCREVEVTFNNNNNTSICKAHNVSIRAESEAPFAVESEAPFAVDPGT